MCASAAPLIDGGKVESEDCPNIDGLVEVIGIGSRKDAVIDFCSVSVWKQSGPNAFYFSDEDVFHGFGKVDVHDKGCCFHDGDHWFANFWKGKAYGENSFYSSWVISFSGQFKMDAITAISSASRPTEQAVWSRGTKEFL